MATDQTLLTVNGKPTYTGVSLHTSAYNLPIPIVWGKRRISPNVIWWSTIANTVSNAGFIVGTQQNTVGPIFGKVHFNSGSNFQEVIVGERATVPSTGPYTYTANHPHYSANISVSYYGTSITLTDVSPSSPTAAGQYSVNLSTGLYTFDSADANALVVLNYTWTQSAAVTVPPSGQANFIPVIFALCEGPVDSVGPAWDGTSPVGTYQTLQAYSGVAPLQGYTFFNGSSTQAVWGEWANRNLAPPINSFTEEALIPYRFTALLAAWYVFAGTDQTDIQLPQQSFECVRHNLGSTYASPPGDYSLGAIIPDILTSPQYGAGLVTADYDSTTGGQFLNYQNNQGLFFSPLLTGQDKCIDILDRWARLSNSWIFWSGTAIFFVPLADAIIGSFTPDVTPAYALGINDFLDRDHPVTVDRTDPADCYNRVVVQISDRAFGYSSNPIEWKDQGLIDQYGVLDAASVQGDDICDAHVGETVASLIGQRLAYVRNVYSFTLSYRYILLLPGSIVTLTEPNIGLNAQPVRIRSIEEDDKGQLSIVAEEMPGTTGIASGSTVYTSGGSSQASGNMTNTNVDPGSVNTPAIIEPSSALTGTTPQVWIGASGGVNWGGATVYVSTDNVNYTQIGVVGINVAGFGGPSPQALLTANLASHADPDTTNTLGVDFTESAFILPTNTTHADADAGRSLSVIAAPPTGTNPLVMPSTWELLSYGTVTSTGTFTDNLTYLRRGQYGSAPAGHSTGDDFTVLGLYTTLKWNLQAQYVGVTLYFKFASFNPYGNGQQQLADVPAYEYVPTGAGFSGAGWLATGAPGGNIVVFQPVGPIAQGDVYITEATALAAAQAISALGGPVDIYFDGTHNSGAVTCALAWVFTGATVRMYGVQYAVAGSGTNETVITWATGSSISGVTYFQDGQFRSSSTSPIITNAAANFQQLLIFDNAGVNGSASAPFYRQTGATSTLLAYLLNQAGAGDLHTAFDAANAGAGYNVYLGDFSVLYSGGATSTGGAAFDIRYKNNSARNQNGAGVTIYDTSAFNDGYPATVPANWAGGVSPGTEGLALDQLAARGQLPAVGTEGQFLSVNATPAPAYVSISGDIDASTSTPGQLHVHAISGTSGGGGNIPLNISSMTWATSGTLVGATTVKGTFTVEASGGAVLWQMLPISGTNPGLYGNVTPSSTNFALYSSSAATILNVGSGGVLSLDVNDVAMVDIDATNGVRLFDSGSNALWQLTEVPSSTVPAIYAQGNSPGANNYSILAITASTVINAPSATGAVSLAIQGVGYVVVGGAGLSLERSPTMSLAGGTLTVDTTTGGNGYCIYPTLVFSGNVTGAVTLTVPNSVGEWSLDLNNVTIGAGGSLIASSGSGSGTFLHPGFTATLIKLLATGANGVSWSYSN